MCKGIAILINDKDIKMNEKKSSHSELGNEDNYLKVNVIYDDREKRGYRFEVDDHGGDQIKEYKKKCYLTPGGEIIPSYLKRLEEFCKENEHKFFKLFCRLLQNAYIEGSQYNDSATIKGYQYNSSATIKGYQYNSSATIEGSQDNGLATIKGCQYNSSATIKGGQYNSSATIKGCQNNSSATIEGYQNNSSATIKGCQNNSSATIEDSQYNSSATIEGYQNNSSATIKKDIILFNTIIGTKNSKTSKLIKKFSKQCDNMSKTTLTNFIKWLKVNKQ